MAITLISQPGYYRPAYNPIQWVFSSDNVGECDFKYILDLYINNVYIIRLKAYAQGANEYGYFNLERIFQDFLTHDFQHELIEYYANPNSILTYYVNIRESYNTSSDCSGSSTVSSVLYTSTSLPLGENYAWNGALSYFQYPQYTQTTYVATDQQSKFLTNSPRRVRLGINDYYTLDFLQDSSGSAEQVYTTVVDTYDIGGGLLGSYSFDNPYYTPSDYTELMLSVGVGPKSLNQTNFNGAPTQPVIDSSVHYYRVYLQDASTNVISEVKEFEIDRRCTKYKNIRLWWLNRLGGFDSYTFNLVSKRNVSSSRTNFQKKLATDYTIGDRGETTISVDARETYTFTSNWMTEDEAIWMEELFTSPEVYAIDYTTTNPTYAIDGAMYNAGTVDIALPGLVQLLNPGTEFTYIVDDGSPIGMPNMGTATITGFDIGTGYHHTDIPATINAGALITGSLSAIVEDAAVIPIVITSNNWEEKLKSTTKNINYTIECRTSYPINTQNH